MAVGPSKVAGRAGGSAVRGGWLADPTLTYQVSGLQLSDHEADVLSGLLSRVAGAHVASSPYAITQGLLTADSDYTIRFTGSALTITPATLSVAADSQTKVYGAADPALTYQVSGLKLSDPEAGVLSGLTLPSTRKEGELLGDAREQVVERARDLVTEKKTQVQHVARKYQSKKKPRKG